MVGGIPDFFGPVVVGRMVVEGGMLEMGAILG